MSDALDKAFDNVFDALKRPPRQADYALVSSDDDAEELDGDDMVPEGYTYDTDKRAWVCGTCSAYVQHTHDHSVWHAGLDISSPSE